MRIHRWQRQILDRAARSAGLLPLSDAVATLATTLAVHLLQGGTMPDIAPTHEVRVRLDSLTETGAGTQVLALLVLVGTAPAEETVAATDRWASLAVPTDNDADGGAAWDTAIDAELSARGYLRVGPTLRQPRVAVIPVLVLPAREQEN